MKALLIKPDQTIEAIDIASHDDIVKLIGFDTVISDEVGNDGDCLFFDEDCFLREASGRFQVDSLIPVSGVGIIAGCTDNNKNSAALVDVNMTTEELKSRIKYL